MDTTPQQIDPTTLMMLSKLLAQMQQGQQYGQGYGARSPMLTQQQPAASGLSALNNSQIPQLLANALKGILGNGGGANAAAPAAVPVPAPGDAGISSLGGMA
jgi:hypothetical protein